MDIAHSQNSTAIPVWVPNPQQRGTWNIYQTCTITIILCIWTTAHVNLPGPEEKKYKQTIRKISYSLIALLLPEFSVLNAWVQFQHANELTAIATANATARPRPSLAKRFWNGVCTSAIWPFRIPDYLRMRLFHRLQRQQNADEEELGRIATARDQYNNPDSEWTKQMSFYALSGGCTYRPRNDVPSVLARAAIEYLVKYDSNSLLPFRQAAQKNPSKADSIAKAATCVQILWFCLACAARLSENLAIALLEIVTFAHCIAALLNYVFWWNKPYDVESHVDIRSDSLDFAWLLHQSGVGSLENSVSKPGASEAAPSARLGSVTTLDELGNELFKQQLSFDNAGDTSDTGDAEDITDTADADDSGDNADAGDAGGTAEAADTVSVVSLPRCPSGNFEVPNTGFRLSVQRPDSSNVRMFKLSPVGVQQWQELWRLWEAKGFPRPAKVLRHPLESPWFLERATNHVVWDGISTSIGLSTAFALPVVAYGCLHLLAWNYDFTTNSERTLWRIASAATVAGGLSNLIAPFAVMSYQRLVENDGYERLGCLPFLGIAIAMLIGVVITIPTVLCIGLVAGLGRIFLIVESFKALPNSPASTYLVVHWTTYIPHFG